ncbi:hypothetical protein SERLADRAFT_370958 [Serpula lacrymans var. lacrymans S7.9]|uniref:Deacetylase sirtuin-type domain-containing protein n=1 Tax=Serpula lacrymans var. lacrymans (strain S7.9) TaxID=578457 RepID=F8P055_SERL9|nr:uncharacterized protein SERLADRAFT_370958 [Serpula lacrymans var. lacrymans S7.9]EGO24122.1 hypothetical protein SERLADRAFT_370958 [Serpula lacrymans var. lacrymans S7.9]
MSNKPTYAQDETPRLLDGNNLKAIAKYMKSDSCRNVFVMRFPFAVLIFTLSGISTSAGIPDFRTPGTGKLSNLAKLKLPYAEAVFELKFFRKNPYPFYVVAKELWPGRYRPTLAHAFIKVLHTKNLLHTSFTQNVDMLERRAGVPPEKIIEAHGSYATQTCIDCKKPYDSAKMKEAIKKLTPPQCEKCKGYVKSDIVFFGEAVRRLVVMTSHYLICRKYRCRPHFITRSIAFVTQISL